MKIGIIGSGNIGQALGRRWAASGHQLYYSFSHDSEKLEALARESGNDSKAVTPYDAVRCSDIVLFAPPWTQIDEAIKQVGRFEGQIVIDATNPFIDEAMNTEQFDEGDSSSQDVQRRLGEANVVKAFNTLKAETLREKHGQGLVIYIAGDDSVAKAAVAQLVEDAGFVPEDVGPLVDGRNQQPGTDKFLKEVRAAGPGSRSSETGEIALDLPLHR